MKIDIKYMILKLKRLIIICAFILIGCSKTYIIPAYNDWGEVYPEAVVLSDKVGEEIDSLERRQYNLFPGVVNFETAMLFPIRDGGYVAVVQVTDGRQYYAVIRDPQGIIILRDYLDHYKDIATDRKTFEKRWRIVAYDHDLDLPITQDEVKIYKKNKYAKAYGLGCGISGCVLGLIGIYNLGEPAADPHGFDVELNSFEALLWAGFVTSSYECGKIYGTKLDKQAAVEAIKAGRKLREVE